jgi:cytochrome c oxidase subunit 1
MVRVATSEEIAMVGDPSRSHLPAPSYWPLLLSLSFPLIGYGLIFNMVLAAIGGAVLLGSMVGWALEPPDDEDLPPHGPEDHDDGDGEALAEPDPVEPEREEVTVGD